MQHVFIIITNFNNKDGTLRLLRQVIGYSGHATFLVVDNASTDGSEAAIKGQFPSVMVIQNKANVGFVKSINVGLQFALANRATHAIVLSPTVMVESDFVEAMLSKNYDLFSPVIVRKDKKSELYATGGRLLGRSKKPSLIWQNQKPAKSFNTTPQFVSALCFGIRLACIQKTGLFDEQFNQFFADADFGLRAKLAGFKLGVIPTAQATLLPNRYEGARLAIVRQSYLSDAFAYIRKQSKFSLFGRLTQNLAIRLYMGNIHDGNILAIYAS